MIIKYGSAWVAIIVTCFLLIIVAVLGKQEQLRYQEDMRADVVSELSQVRARLESEVNANLHLTRGLVSLVTAYPNFTPDEFAKAGQVLLRGKTNVRNVGLAPNNVLNHIYPIEGNEMAIGLVYEDNPIQWPALARAIEQHKTILSGPIELVEGDQAFVSLTPIWLKEGNAEHYWGAASMVINADTLFSSAGVVQSELDIKLAIRGVDGMG
ncbi:MAG: CHASE domain-containing protein, partial [Nitrosomonas sp.]|nr:CHASE domain-containing protein [Nitrosomonas sp.]